MKVKDLTGQIFEKITVLGRNTTAPNNSTAAIWDCVCECGNQTIVAGWKLRSGATKSCGCRRAEVAHNNFNRHGMSDTSEHNIWLSMKARCFNEKSEAYRNYGERGITVCDRWLTFENFLADMGRRPTAQHSIDRIDNSKGYSPENCKWTDSKSQNRNKRTNVLVEYQGRKMSMVEAAELIGIGYKQLWAKLKKGMDLEAIAASY